MADRRLLLLIVAVIALGIAVIFLWSRRPDTDRVVPPQQEELSPAATEEPPREPITVIAAADIACDPDEDGFRDGEGREGVCQQMATSELALAAEPDLVLMPGDTQYEEAELDDYRESFHPSWGRLKERIRPVPGNHEYGTEDAAGYFAYFGDAAGDPSRGYYAFEQGDWLIIGVNSVCEEVGGCEPGDDQFEWLRQTLEGSDATCQLAFWHHPRWSNGNYDDDDSVAAMYELLYEHGVELLLSGDSHNYQRFEPLDPDRQVGDQGVRQFVVGAAGKNLKEAEPGGSLAAANFEEMGVLALELRAGDYSWEFLSTGDAFTDTGTADCR